MKRYPELQPLSRQHHNELMACLLLKKGIQKKTGITVLQDFLRQFWQNDLQPHIKEEENSLIPLLQSNQKLRMYASVIHGSHELIERIYERNKSQLASYRNLELFINTLEQHILFEERVVFEEAQRNLPQHALKQLQVQENATGDCSRYPVKFWE
jgi:hemerythrin-like domain-containing protein